MNDSEKLKDLGGSEYFQGNSDLAELSGFIIGRVIAEHRGSYQVRYISGETTAKVTGKLMHEAKTREDYPAVGDWVLLKDDTSDTSSITQILPRKTIIKRKKSGADEEQVIACNVDIALIVESVDRDFNLNRIERYLTIVEEGGIKPVIILNKIDLVDQEELDNKIKEIQNRFPNISCITTSTVGGKGLDELKSSIKYGKTYCFLGSSGVGKSSLINSLIGDTTIETKSIGSKTERGRHTTTHREIYFLVSGGILIDNPGMREVGVGEVSTAIERIFADILQSGSGCKFADCTHTHEPGCMVKQAVEDGQLDEEKYQNYQNLRKETEYYQSSELERRQKDRNFGKFLKSAKEQLKKSGHKDY
jgi:ribosome biogenesis GTPase